MKYRVRAYTLLETLLTLVISSLVIVFIYTLYVYLDKQLLDFKESNNHLLHYMIFEETFKREMHLASDILGTEQTLVLTYYDEREIQYHVRNDSLFRLENDMSSYTGLKTKQMRVTQSEVANYEIVKVALLIASNKEIIAKDFYSRKRKIVLTSEKDGLDED